MNGRIQKIKGFNKFVVFVNTTDGYEHQIGVIYYSKNEKEAREIAEAKIKAAFERKMTYEDWYKMPIFIENI